MLSRLALRSAPLRGNLVQCTRTAASTPDACSAPATAPGAVAGAAAGGRDLANFPRIVRGEPGKVRLGFLPEEWFQFFHKKTGVTGPYTFGVGLITYLFSKEIYIMEHEYYSGLSILVMIIVGAKKFGPQFGAWADKEVEAIEEEWNAGRNNELKTLGDAIEAEKKAQWSAQGQELLFQAKKENVLLQLEAAYRERLMSAYSEVKKRLDYQVEKDYVEKRISQKHMVQWIVSNVLKSITPDQEKQTLDRCIADLGVLAVRK